MKLLNVVSLLNVLTVVPVVSAYGYGGWHTGFEPIVSGSSAQRADDRWGNSNQIHGKHVQDYAYERMYGRPVTQNHQQLDQEQQVQQQQQQQQQPQNPGQTEMTESAEPPEVQFYAKADDEEEQLKHKVATVAQEVSAEAAATTFDPMAKGLLQMQMTQNGDQTASNNPATAASAVAATTVPQTANPQAVPAFANWHGRFQPVISGSSAQYDYDRYGNYHQLHNKHVHDYAFERMKHIERQMMSTLNEAEQLREA